MARDSTLIDAFLSERASLLRVASGIVRDRWRAEDVLQDAYVRLRNSPPGVPVEQPRSYLIRLTRNLAIDVTRRLSRETRGRTTAAAPMPEEVEARTPEDAALHRDMLHRLEAALTELPDRTRTIFERVRVGGHTVEDVAKEMGISPRLVHLHLRDAMTHCRARLYPAHGR